MSHGVPSEGLVTDRLSAAGQSECQESGGDPGMLTQKAPSGPHPLSLVGKSLAAGCLTLQVGSKKGFSGDKIGSHVRATNCKKGQWL